KTENDAAELGSCNGYAQNCNIGDILNSDGTCSSIKEKDKAPIGVVVAIKDNCGWAITVNPIKGSFAWSRRNTATGSGTTTDVQSAIKNFDACTNTQKIIQLGDSEQYPAAWAAVNYAPNTAPETMGKWCLPAPGILNSLYTNMNVIENVVPEIGGTPFNERIWSSSEQTDSGAWTFVSNHGISAYGKSSNLSVRPVIEF
ncbi:MAG: hypothetical protein Q4F75_03940, partial [Pseudomonadota bacterium]|nr:hypothetical protein [Pseudomonadota bacterium]